MSASWNAGQRQALEAMGFVLHVRTSTAAMPGAPADPPPAPVGPDRGPVPGDAAAAPAPEPVSPRLLAALYRAIGEAGEGSEQAFPILLPPPAVLRTAAGKRALWPALRGLRRERARGR